MNIRFLCGEEVVMEASASADSIPKITEQVVHDDVIYKVVMVQRAYTITTPMMQQSTLEVDNVEVLLERV